MIFPAARIVCRPRVLSALAVLLGTVVVLAMPLASPAQAHGRSSDATNFDSRLLAVPDIEGVTWQIHGGDEYLSLDNAGTQEVLVLGYEGESWLRVGPDGVFQNVRSAATYVNADRYAQVDVPDLVDPNAEPEWERLSDGHFWYWHDHRVHWMSPTPPPAVRGAPGQAHVVQEWEVPIEVGGAAMAVTGELWWIPPPATAPWLLAGALVSLPALAGLARGRSSPKALIRPAAAVLALVAAVNILHFADDLFAAPAPLSAKALAAAQTAIFIAVAMFGAVRGWQAREGAFTALGVGSVAAFIGQGLLYVPALTSSQLQSLTPEGIGRFAIGLSLLQLIPVGLVAVLGTRRFVPVGSGPVDDGAGEDTTDGGSSSGGERGPASDLGSSPAPR